MQDTTYFLTIKNRRQKKLGLFPDYSSKVSLRVYVCLRSDKLYFAVMYKHHKTALGTFPFRKTTWVLHVQNYDHMKNVKLVLFTHVNNVKHVKKHGQDGILEHFHVVMCEAHINSHVKLMGIHVKHVNLV